ncbi:MAG: hypothetical protein IKU42_06145 [Oscillospiraceae bacterium]|nr:hypothetical protein [Oscillospiraceae bacterium]
MKKLISIILCLAMVFAMSATVFGAVSGAYFTVMKTDEAGNPLEGAEFALIPSTTSEPAYVATSNEEGVVVFAGIMDGMYTLKETAAPAGYIKSDVEYSLTIRNGLVIVGIETDDSGNTQEIFYDDQNPYVIVNEKEDDVIDFITIYIPITKIVEQTGMKAPGAETFAFEIYDFRYNGEVKIVSNTVETNGAGTYNENLLIEVETEDIIYEGFLIREIKETKDGWTYSDAVYEAMPIFDDNGDWTGEFEFTIEENGDPVTYDKATFVNSYKKSVYAPANPAPKEEIRIDTEENPNTGAPVFAIPAVLAVMAGAAVVGKRK